MRHGFIFVHREVTNLTAVEKIANTSSSQGYQAASSSSSESVSLIDKKREVITELPSKDFAGSETDEQAASSQIQSKGDSKTANEEIRKKVDQINKEMLNQNSEAIFGIHDDTNRVTIKIVDKDSKKVIKEFPPEKTLDMLAKLWEVAGIMVDEKR